MGADNALEVTAVLANGTAVTASRCQNPDLFWALRGGGGSSFAVVTSATYVLHAYQPAGVAGLELEVSLLRGEQSMAISRIGGFHIIISASGMCEAGRIRHHLKDWLWRPEATVLLVGYQANGSLGRTLLEGTRHVRMMGSEIEVKATIRSMDVYSGHADAPELLEWVKARAPIKGSIFLVHGEAEAQNAFQQTLQKTLNATPVCLPSLDECYDIDGRTATLAQSQTRPRLDPAMAGSKDWNNDFTQLIFELKQAVHRESDEKGRAKLIRKIRQALDNH
jgi:metallo-beta-lactamase family protein